MTDAADEAGRAGPTFTDEERARIEALTERYPTRAAALLPVLHLAQDKFGHLDRDVQWLVARALDVPPTRVKEVVSFYEMFHEHREGQFHIEVCTNIACHLLGGDAVLGHLKSKLGIGPGEVTSDGMFSLMEAECLASCGSAVCVKVGLDYYEHVTPDGLDKLLDDFRALAPSLEGRDYHHAAPEPHVGPVPGFEPTRGGEDR